MTQLSAQRTDPSIGANYVVFNTGYGEGHYRTSPSSVTVEVVSTLWREFLKDAG